MDLTEVEDIKKRWQDTQKNCTKKGLSDPDNHDGASIAPQPVESLEAPTNSTVPLSYQRHNKKLPEVTGTSRGNPGFSAVT